MSDTHSYLGDYLFIRLTAEDLAKAMIGDVRATPNAWQIENAQVILNRTGHLYRTPSDFRIADWEYKIVNKGAKL